MKKVVFSALLFVSLPFAAQASCESVMQDIHKKIIDNGVEESNFTLTLIPSDQVKENEHVVGNCENDSQKIVYQRSHGASMSEHKPMASSMTDHKPMDGSTTEAKPMDGSTTEAKPMDESMTEAKPMDGSMTEAKPMDGSMTEAKPMDESMTDDKSMSNSQ